MQNFILELQHLNILFKFSIPCDNLKFSSRLSLALKWNRHSLQ